MPHRLSLVLAASLLLALAGCTNPVAGDGGSPPVTFGDPYTVVVPPLPDDPPLPPNYLPPVLDGDRLSVTVTYGGGCAEHVFTLHARPAGLLTDVWLEHDAGGDRCEALITERRTVVVPRTDGGRLRLLLPGGGANLIR